MVNQPRALADLDTQMAERFVVIRGQRVILDSDLAEIFGVPTKRLNERVRRHPGRFPADFMFLLSSHEWESLRSQIAASKPGRRTYRRYLPYVFTEHGAFMASSVLKSPRATEVSVQIVRALGGVL